MSVFLDTSALFSVMVQNDENHVLAQRIWNRILDDAEPVFTTNYVILEMYTLLQRRIGVDAVRDFHTHLVPYMRLVWVDAPQYARAVEIYLSVGERQLSLVDCTSFVVCRDTGTDRVFAFDRHFERAGFRVVH